MGATPTPRIRYCEDFFTLATNIFIFNLGHHSSKSIQWFLQTPLAKLGYPIFNREIWENWSINSQIATAVFYTDYYKWLLPLIYSSCRNLNFVYWCLKSWKFIYQKNLLNKNKFVKNEIWNQNSFMINS